MSLSLKKVARIALVIALPFLFHVSIVLISYYFHLPPLASHVRQLGEELKQNGIEEIDPRGTWIDRGPTEKKIYARFLSSMERAVRYEDFGLAPLTLIVAVFFGMWILGEIPLIKIYFLCGPYVVWRVGPAEALQPIVYVGVVWVGYLMFNWKVRMSRMGRTVSSVRH